MIKWELIWKKALKIDGENLAQTQFENDFSLLEEDSITVKKVLQQQDKG